MITAVGIKKLWYGETSLVKNDLTGAALKGFLNSETAVLKEVSNVHQGSWSLEEAEPSKTAYKNQLTGNTYREDIEMGEVKMSFTIGEYDNQTKANLMGGTATATSWKRARGKVKIEKLMIALTEDDQYVVFPRASIIGREANTDGAIGVAVAATALEPQLASVMPEYWFDMSEVK